MGIGLVKYWPVLQQIFGGWFVWKATAAGVMVWFLGFFIAYLAKRRNQFLAWNRGVTKTQIWPWIKESKWRVALFFSGAVLAMFI